VAGGGGGGADAAEAFVAGSEDFFSSLARQVSMLSTSPVYLLVA